MKRRSRRYLCLTTSLLSLILRQEQSLSPNQTPPLGELLRIDRMLVHLLVATTLGAAAFAQQGLYAQCGGDGYTGPSVCAAQYTCSYVNQYYSYCVLSAQAGTSGTAASSTASGSTSSTAGKLKWLGINSSGAEWGTVFPGVAGTDYTFPDTNALKVCFVKYSSFEHPTKRSHLDVDKPRLQHRPCAFRNGEDGSGVHY